MNHIVFYKGPHLFMSSIEISKIALYSESNWVTVLMHLYIWNWYENYKWIWLYFLKSLPMKNFCPLISNEHQENSSQCIVSPSGNILDS